MRTQGGYRFSLQFAAETEEQIRAGEFLERMGNRKSAIVVNAISHYLDANPDADFGRQVVMDRDLLEYACENEIAAIAYSPLLKGYYGNREKALDVRFVSSENERRLRALDRFANEHGITTPQAVYAWLLSHDPSVIPIVAASSSRQFSQALAATEIRFSENEMKELSN